MFAGRLGLSKKDVLIPEHPELMMAYGAALSLERLAGEVPKGRTAGAFGRASDQVKGK